MQDIYNILSCKISKDIARRWGFAHSQYNYLCFPLTPDSKTFSCLFPIDYLEIGVYIFSL